MNNYNLKSENMVPVTDLKLDNEVSESYSKNDYKDKSNYQYDDTEYDLDDELTTSEEDSSTIEAENLEEMKQIEDSLVDTVEFKVEIPSELIHYRRLLNFILQSQNKVHPLAGKATADIVISALTSRWVYSPTKASTALYMAVIAPTGSGKNIGVSATETILNAVQQNQKIVTSNFSSIGAMDDMFKLSESIVNVIDELGDALKNMEKGSQKELATKMKKLYTSSMDSSYMYGKYSSNGGKNSIRGFQPFPRPFYSILGLSTLEQFVSSVNMQMLNDGFVNRFVILNGEDIPPIFNKTVSSNVPRDIIAHIKSISMKRMPLIIENSKPEYYNENKYKVLTMTEEAWHYYEQFIGDADITGTDIYKFCSASKEMNITLANNRRNISIRWRENAIRYATALTAYEGKSEIELFVLKYAYEFIKEAGIAFLDLFQDEVVQTPLQKNMAIALKWFKNRTKKFYSLSYIGPNMYGLKHLKSSQRKAALNELVAIGELQTRSKGRATEYALV